MFALPQNLDVAKYLKQALSTSTRSHSHNSASLHSQKFFNYRLAMFYWTLALIVFARVIFSLYKYYLSPLRDIPGPLLARITNFWYFFKVYKGCFEKENIELHRKYGM